MIILDSSFFLAALLPDERHATASHILDTIIQGSQQACVPALFYTEVTNACVMAFRRNHLSQEGLNSCVATLSSVPIPIDDTCALAPCTQIALTHGLTIYDATYLEMAQRHHGTLATLDKMLQKAARACHCLFPEL